MDSDYGAQYESGQPVQFPASPSLEEEITISIPITSDSVAETLEAFAAALTTEQESVLVQDGMATITIRDDDGKPIE